MARFFLFTFTILLSLSLGLFVGQNYFLELNEVEIVQEPSSKSQAGESVSGYENEDPKASDNSADLDNDSDPNDFSLSKSFYKILDKIFANEEVEPVSDTSAADIRMESEEISKPMVEKEVSLDEEEPENSEPFGRKNVEEKLTGDAPPKDSPQKMVVEKQEPQQISGWVIQVSAFQLEKDAVSVLEKIKSKNLIGFYYKIDLKGKDWYRVNIGPFESINDATTYKMKNKISRIFSGSFIKKIEPIKDFES